MNLEVIKQRTGNRTDIVIRPVKLGQDPKVKTAIVYKGWWTVKLLTIF